MPYQAFADAILLLHFGIVVFVLLGLPAIPLGNWLGWSWVNRLWWRLTHLATIVIVVLQAWLGKYCPLTSLEVWLRKRAGQAPYDGSFIAHWVQSILFYEAPGWVFTVAYTGFGLLVVWAWWRYPPTVKKATDRET